MDTKDIRAILFDKDGTLLKYDETWGPINWAAALKATRGDEEKALLLLEATGLDIEKNKVRVGSILGAGNTAEIAAAWAGKDSELSVSELMPMLDETFVSAMEHAVEIPGLKETIKLFASSGYEIGVASSDSLQSIHRFVAQMGLTSFFGFACGYDSGYGHKPEPGMLLAFCEAIGVDPSQVAMVGDNPQDMQMAKAAGAGLKIAVLSGNGTRDDLAPLADIVLEDISGLPTVFDLGHARSVALAN